MEFFQHTQEWIQGEMFESICIAIGGITLLSIALACFLLGSTANTTALSIPFAIIGFILLLGGVMMYRENVKRMTEFSERFIANETAFVTTEKERVATFDAMYKSGKIMTLAFFTLGLLLTYFMKNPYLKSIGISLLFLGISIVLIDHFSKERAQTYAIRIQNYLK